MSHDSVVSRALEEFRRRERRTGKEKGRCRKVGDRRLRSNAEKICSQDSFAVWTLAALV